MTVAIRPHHPARLAGVFIAAVAAFGLIASAAYAVIYIVHNETASPTVQSAPGTDLDLPPGMVVIRPTDRAEWNDALGFEPVLPQRLPQGVVETPVYFLQPPDPEFGVAGHVRYAYGDGAPAIALIEQDGGLDTSSPTKVLESAGTRAYIVNMPCGDIVLQVQVFFAAEGAGSLAPAEATVYAESFMQAMRDQCAAD